MEGEVKGEEDVGGGEVGAQEGEAEELGSEKRLTLMTRGGCRREEQLKCTPS